MLSDKSLLRLQQHVDSRNVSRLVLQFNNCVQELEDFCVLERCTYLHLLLHTFAVFLGGSFSELNQRAGYHAVVGDVGRFQHTWI